jgi:hypothetical protein
MDVTQVLLKVLDVANPLAGMAAEFIAGKMGLGSNTVEAVKDAVAGVTGADKIKLAEIQAGLQDHLAQYGLQLQTTEIQAAATVVAAVNTTLQADARGDSWLQKNHHAMESLATVACVIGVYFVLPLAHIPVPSVPEAAYLMLGAILGVTSWQRGQVNSIIARGNAPAEMPAQSTPGK